MTAVTELGKKGAVESEPDKAVAMGVHGRRLRERVETVAKYNRSVRTRYSFLD
jgi:hypothetical protein